MALGPLVPSLTYEIPAGGPILLIPRIVDREADALTASQFFANPVNRLMGLFTGRLPGSCETNDLGLKKRPGSVTAPPLRDAPHIEDVADPLPAVGVDLPEDLNLPLEVLRNRLAAQPFQQSDLAAMDVQHSIAIVLRFGEGDSRARVGEMLRKQGG